MPTTHADALRLTSADGHSFACYRARPAKGEHAERQRGGVVVIQEIFGVNRHIRGVADRYAEQGYLVLAPAVFERVEPGMEFGYDQQSIEAGRAVRGKIDNKDAVADVGAAVAWLGKQGLKVGVVGYCWGGLLTWLSAARLPIAAASSYYGGGIENNVADQPKVPIQLHYGLKDAYIPDAARKAARGAAPKAEYFEYDADHGFCCDERGSFHAESCRTATARTLDFFHRHVG
jgi:carboxymethylenebutenolidase